MLEEERDRRRGESSMSCFRPFDERDRTVEVRLDIPPLRVAQAAEPVQVEVRDRGRPLVEMADRERGARDGPVDAERAARPPHERGLASAELAAEKHDVSGHEQPREQGPERLCLGRRMRRRLDHGSEEAELGRADSNGILCGDGRNLCSRSRQDSGSSRSRQDSGSSVNSVNSLSYRSTAHTARQALAEEGR